MKRTFFITLILAGVFLTIASFAFAAAPKGGPPQPEPGVQNSEAAAQPAKTQMTQSTEVGQVVSQGSKAVAVPLVKGSVPNLINFQGKLTTAGGAPVADIVHLFVFRLFNVPAGGVSLWTEPPAGTIGISTSTGLFNHQLGSTTTIPTTLFEAQDELYLEITADGEVQTPRIRLVSAPYARIANGLEGKSTLVPETTYIATIPGAHQLSTYGSDGKEQIRLWGNSWGEIYLYDSDASNDITATLSANGNSGGFLGLDHEDGTASVTLQAGTTTTGSLMTMRSADGGTAVELDGEGTSAAGEVSLFDPDGTKTVEIRAADAATTGSEIILRKADGTYSIEIDAEFGAAGASGRIIVPVLQITGGSDLSEQFDVNAAPNELQPGMVVSIDAANPGQLLVSHKAYDQKVAGIISGAGSVSPGLLMGQKDTEADGKHPIALTGRVYCWADASNSPIVPGDLLTTSDTPGHAMKVNDYRKAQGAVIGKAMSSLEKGKGLVLVLVSLQ